MPAQFIFDPRLTEASRPYDMTKLFENLGENLQRRRGVEDRKESIRQQLELDMAKGLLPKANIEIGDNGEYIFDNARAKRAFYDALAPKAADDLSREASGQATEAMLPSTLDAKINKAQNQALQDPTVVTMGDAARAMAANIYQRTNPGLILGPNTPALLLNGGLLPGQTYQGGGPQPQPSAPTPMPEQPTAPTSQPSTTTVSGGFGPVTLPTSPLLPQQPTVPQAQEPSAAFTPLGVGSRGAAVKAMQTALGIKADGVFGPGTQAKLKDYQTRNGLPATGQIDQATAKLMQLPAAEQQNAPTGRTKNQTQDKLSAGQLEQMGAQYKAPSIDVSEERYSVKTDTRQRARMDEVKESLRSLAGASTLANIANTVGEGTGLNRKGPAQNVYQTLFNERVKQLAEYEKASKEDLPQQTIAKQGKEEYKVTGSEYNLTAKEAVKAEAAKTILNLNTGPQRTFDESVRKLFFTSVAGQVAGKFSKQLAVVDPATGTFIETVPGLAIEGRGQKQNQKGQRYTWFNNEQDALHTIQTRLNPLATRYKATYEFGGSPSNGQITRNGQPIAQMRWVDAYSQYTLDALPGATPDEIATITGMNYNLQGQQEEANK